MRVLDASVLVKLVTEEPGSDAARALLAKEADLSMPQLAVLEVASALSKKVRYHGLPIEQAQQALATLTGFGIDTVPDSGLIERAMMLSVEMGHAIQDCMYLALAEAFHGQLITADRKFSDKRESYSGMAVILPLAHR